MAGEIERENPDGTRSPMTIYLENSQTGQWQPRGLRRTQRKEDLSSGVARVGGFLEDYGNQR
jgi:hypothetical protein